MRKKNNEKRLHYYAAGLGDGSVRVPDKQQQQGLRGRKRDDGNNDNSKVSSSFRESVDRATTMMMDGSDSNYKHHYHPSDSSLDEANHQRIISEYNSHDGNNDMIPHGHSLRMTSSDYDNYGSTWQLSLIVLLGIICMLIALFIHFLTDNNSNNSNSKDNKYYYLRSRQGRMKNKMYKSSNYRKKTDEWSDDSEDYNKEDDYIDNNTNTTDETNVAGSTSGSVGCSSGILLSGNIAKKRMNIPASPIPPHDPTARLYYGGKNDNGTNAAASTTTTFRQQESRLRKSTTAAAANTTTAAAAPQQQQHSTFQSPSRNKGGVSNNNNNRSSFTSATSSYEMSPGMTRRVGSSPRASPNNDGNAMPNKNRFDNKDRVVDNAANNNQVLQHHLPPTPPFMDGDIGSGLEGFEHSVITANDNYNPIGEERNNDATTTAIMNSNTSWDDNDVTAGHNTNIMRVRPMGSFTPTDSFIAMPSDHEGSDENTVTPPVAITDETNEQQTAVDSTATTPSLNDYSPGGYDHTPNKEEAALSSPARNNIRSYYGNTNDTNLMEELDMATPRVENSKRELGMQLLMGGCGGSNPSIDLTEFALPFTELEDNNSLSRDKLPPPIPNDDNSNNNATNESLMYTTKELHGMPLVPNLNSSPRQYDSGNTEKSAEAPRSVLLEELHLIRMESGVPGPRWISELEQSRLHPAMDETAAPSMDSPLKYGGQDYTHPMFGNDESSSTTNTAWYEPVDSEVLEKRRQVSENEAKLREASSVMDPSDDPRNSIQHIRKDLTESSDTSSSLSSKIAFSELKLLQVIGGGGFGQVWKAKWKGTPVAVKVLTGAAQAETVPKAVIEEFVAEINMVSGMRHPNICLFMGACLDPPNRAIVTELCENGSLWDALRMPLSSPYVAADGRTRDAWPLELYDSLNQPPSSSMHPGQTLDDGNNPPIAPSGAWPWVLVKRVASGTARGMCYMHSGNPPVLHRDLKSANILLDESYTAKLADFGLSRLKAVRSGMTGNCGTVQWMAPEVLCSEDYAEPADVFSFGIILWEMLTKECPYDGMTPIQCALSVLNENKRPPIPNWCPQSFRALIKNCVERNPKDRPTFNEILSALDSLP